MIKQSLGGESEVWWEGFCSRVGIKAGDQWSKRPSRLPAHWEWTLLFKFHILLVARQENLTELITKLKKRLQSRSTANSYFPTMIYFVFGRPMTWTCKPFRTLSIQESRQSVKVAQAQAQAHAHAHALSSSCTLCLPSPWWLRSMAKTKIKQVFFFFFSFLFFSFFFFVEMSLTHSPLVT